MKAVTVLRKPLEGTVAQNCLTHGAGALNVDGIRIAGIDPANAKRLGRNYTHEDTNFGDAKFGQKTQAVVGGNLAGRWPSNVILHERVAAQLDEQSGVSFSSGGRIGNKDGGGIYGGGKGLKGLYEQGDPGYGDIGGASRFFKQVKE